MIGGFFLEAKKMITPTKSDTIKIKKRQKNRKRHLR